MGPPQYGRGPGYCSGVSRRPIPKRLAYLAWPVQDPPAGLPSLHAPRLAPPSARTAGPTCQSPSSNRVGHSGEPCPPSLGSRFRSIDAPGEDESRFARFCSDYGLGVAIPAAVLPSGLQGDCSLLLHPGDGRLLAETTGLWLQAEDSSRGSRLPGDLSSSNRGVDVILRTVGDS